MSFKVGQMLSWAICYPVTLYRYISHAFIKGVKSLKNLPLKRLLKKGKLKGINKGLILKGYKCPFWYLVLRYFNHSTWMYILQQWLNGSRFRRCWLTDSRWSLGITKIFLRPKTAVRSRPLHWKCPSKPISSYKNSQIQTPRYAGAFEIQTENKCHHLCILFIALSLKLSHEFGL